jgi:cytochrome c peroxidase
VTDSRRPDETAAWQALAAHYRPMWSRYVQRLVRRPLMIPSRSISAPSIGGTSTSTYQHLVLSIAADEASPDASAFSSNFDYALAHPQEKVLSPDENAGYQLFRGKGLCNMCHLDGTQNTAAVKYTSCLRKREDLNNDLPAFNSDTSWTLPMPGRFVIGQDRVIRYAEINPDYTHRPEPADMLSTLRSIRVTRGA